jgi:hypothetical protein
MRGVVKGVLLVIGGNASAYSFPSRKIEIREFYFSCAIYGNSNSLNTLFQHNRGFASQLHR